MKELVKQAIEDIDKVYSGEYSCKQNIKQIYYKGLYYDVSYTITKTKVSEE